EERLRGRRALGRRARRLHAPLRAQPRDPADAVPQHGVDVPRHDAGGRRPAYAGLRRGRGRADERLMASRALGEIRFVTVDSRNPERLAEFWSRVLGVEVEERFGDGYVILSRAAEGAPRVTFQSVPEEKAGKNRLHFDL